MVEPIPDNIPPDFFWGRAGGAAGLVAGAKDLWGAALREPKSPPPDLPPPPRLERYSFTTLILYQGFRKDIRNH